MHQRDDCTVRVDIESNYYSIVEVERLNEQTKRRTGDWRTRTSVRVHGDLAWILSPFRRRKGQANVSFFADGVWQFVVDPTG